MTPLIIALATSITWTSSSNNICKPTEEVEVCEKTYKRGTICRAGVCDTWVEKSCRMTPSVTCTWEVKEKAKP